MPAVTATPGSNAATKRRLYEPLALPAHGVLALSATVIAFATGSDCFDYDEALFEDGVGATLFFTSIAFAIRWVGFERLATICEMAILSVAIPIAIAFCSLVLASSSLPFRDVELAAIDMQLFGLHRHHVADVLAKWPYLSTVSQWIYDSLAVTPYLLLIVAIWSRRIRLAWIIMASLAVTAMAAILIMPLVPALGRPPAAYHFVDIFEAVRSGQLRRLDGGAITGLVTFPSVHAADGVILAWGFSRFGILALPLTVLSVLLIGSALLTGGHYLIDLLAGVALAALVLHLMVKLAAKLDQRALYQA